MRSLGCLADGRYRDLTLGESFHALENGDLHQWIRYSVDTQFFQFHADSARNLFPTIKFQGILRFVAVYPFINRIFKFLIANISSIAEKRKSHSEFTRMKMESRLSHETDRNDFTAYASALNS